MCAGAHGDASAIENGRDVVSVCALHLKGNDRALVSRRADDAQRVDLAQAL